MNPNESNARIAVCSFGNPLAGSTWSGAPANICRSLSEVGRLGANLNSSDCANPLAVQTARILTNVYYGGSNHPPARGRFHRYLCGRYVDAFCRSRNVTHVLHTGTLDLPLPRLRSSVRHYLFCDSTWDLWRRASSAAATYSDKFMADTERLEQRSYDQMSHIFSISEYVRRNLTDHYKVPSERVTVVGTGRGSLSPYTGSKDYANGVILFVAKIRFEEKGGALLVEAFKRALRQNPRLRLVIVGDERYRASLGNIPNIEIHGFVPLDQLQDLFNRACLYAMPAPNEPWGLVYLEALACKTPVLGLNRNALPEITQQGRFGFCVNDATPDAVAEALLKACSDPEGLARMGAEGQEYCLRQFTWEGTVKRILDVIDASEARAMESGRVGTSLAACGR